jgi:hypothetical protein
VIVPVAPLPVPWEELTEAFQPGIGPDRDIILPGADLERWELAMQWLDVLEHSGAAEIQRWPEHLPELSSFLPETERTSENTKDWDLTWPKEPRLLVVLKGIGIDCPFYEQATIEFQVDASHVDSAANAALVLGFVRDLARAVNLCAFITEENSHDLRWLEYNPAEDRWEWTPLQG